MRQYLVSKGYVVLVPNVRGSTGYGKTYMRLDNKDLGGGPLKDVVACKKWLIKKAHADANKVVVMGGSYGGYMALAAATFVPNEFAANVDFFGVSDLKTLVESFPPYWACGRRVHLQEVRRSEGSRRRQVPARSLADALRRQDRPAAARRAGRSRRAREEGSVGPHRRRRCEQRKVPVHYLVLTDEGHGFSRTESIKAAYSATDRFLDKYIFGDATIDVLPTQATPRP